MAEKGQAVPASEEEFWLFGYGSLIWKPPPHFDRMVPGWINGYVRRFWQASEDHRGTPENPGRVVTLISRSFWSTLPDPHATAPEKVWGVAYRIHPGRVAEVKEYLDIREINGYSIHYTPFHPSSPSSAAAGDDDKKEKEKRDIGGRQLIDKTLVYIGTPDNPQFVGPQDPQALAEHIHRSVGPSGLNRDYLLSLETALNNLGPESGDEHVTDLSDRVRAIEQQQQQQGVAGEKGGANQTTDRTTGASHKHRKVTSVDEQEETEK